MFNKILIFLILLSSAFFFELFFLSSPVITLIQVGLTGMMFLVIIVHEIYGKSETIKKNFKYPIFLIFTGVLLSMIIARAYHNQGYILTLWAQRFMYFYLLYFFLHILKPDIKDLEKIVLTMGILCVILTLVQYAIYPVKFVDIDPLEERGTIRIFIQGTNFMVIALYYYLNRFYNQNKIRYIFPVIIILAITLMQASRTGLSATLLVILFSLIFSKTIKSRYLIYVIVLISIIPLYFIFQDIFGDIIEASESQSKNFESDVRIRAATFYLTDFFPNKLAYFFGNGQDHMRSIYGLRVNAYKIYHGFHQSDIGFIGDFSKYGLFFALGAIWLFLKLLKTPLKPEYTYIKYYLLHRVIILPLTSPFAGTEGIVLLCILMYVIDEKINGLKQERLDEENKSPDEDQDHGNTDCSLKVDSKLSKKT